MTIGFYAVGYIIPEMQRKEISSTEDKNFHILHTGNLYFDHIVMYDKKQVFT